MPQQPPSARSHYAFSALLAVRAAREVVKVRRQGVSAVWRAVARHQMAGALAAGPASARMLAEQGIRESAEALVQPAAFTTDLGVIDKMTSEFAVDDEWARLAASLVQDATRAAEQVMVAATPRVSHVRYVNLPCCSRCAILAGRVYRFSEGFERHPNCDCVMIPTTVASGIAQDPTELVGSGQVRGLSKADMRALDDGADLGRVVNVRLRKAGLSTPGRVLSRAGRPTPEAIYRAHPTDRDAAVQALAAAGYIR